MDGIALKVDKNDMQLNLHISPAEVKGKLDIKILHQRIKQSEFSDFFIFDDVILTTITSHQNALKNQSTDPIMECIGERRESTIKCNIEEGLLGATLTITKGFAGKPLALADLSNCAKEAGVVRGLGEKFLLSLFEQYNQSKSGEEVSAQIARGLPPKTGRSSRLKPLVQNALERILRPQSANNGRVDMRNLGDIICVKIGTELLRRMPPSNGRAGYTVTGDTISAKPGEWLSFKPGDGTVISDKDENLLLAEISGMPKFQDQKMWVDDTYICKGVNVGTGNVNYDGAVLVNGDITENMEITATGDVTVNGFVESATIIAGGDIIITEGAMGKVNETNTSYSSVLRAKGSIHIQHGQGIDIKCEGNVSIGRQLAFSKVICRGEMSVGPVDQPNGNLFACSIFSQNKISAGTFGAVSGSNLTLDFSDGFNALLERKETLDELVKQIRQNFNRHQDRMNIINSKTVPFDMQHRVDEARELFKNETQLMKWLEQKLSELSAAKENYQKDIMLIANKRIYPGVVVKLNNRTWRAEREFSKAKVSFQNHQWHCEPVTS
ncbi:MAG: hypothetical protein ACJA13_003952 [Paraglaciecola sp.]|jgi:uncharacterized protein (DUF342 family)